MRKIIHLDADCFFAAVELRRHPELKIKPVAVGGSPSGRGVISTCNYIARSYGVKSAMSSASALRICPDLHFLTPDMSLYREASNHMFDIFRLYSDTVEAVSIDEAYIDVTHCDQYRGSATLTAKAIQEHIKRELTLPVSAGIAPVKFLAKIASDWNKPEGVFTVAPSEVEGFVSSLSLRLLPGVGPRTWQKLERLGFLTCRDIQSADTRVIIKHFGAFGVQLIKMSKGVDTRPIGGKRDRKSVSVEQTFDSNITCAKELVAKLPILMQRLESRYTSLKGDYKINKRILKLKFGDFTHTSIEDGAYRHKNRVDYSAFERLLYMAKQRSNQPVRLLGLGYRFASPDGLRQIELPLN